MPMIDAYIPEGALQPEAEAMLCKSLTDILLRAEGFDPSNPIAQSVSVIFSIARRRFSSEASALACLTTESFLRCRKDNTIIFQDRRW